MSLGELQFVSGLTADTRRWLSLFTFAGDTLRGRPTMRSTLLSGRHEVSTRLDIPLYTRAGNRPHSADELSQYPNRAYLGNGMGNTARYRYKHRAAAYGLTLQKDAGEPFARRGNYPYDYTSAYFHMAPEERPYALWLGDYTVHAGEGLLAGNSFINSKLQMTESGAATRKEIRPHTSSDEAAFMRGAAVRLRRNSWTLLAFGSWRKRDGRTTGDTLVTFYDDGLHRTVGEIAARRQVDNLTAGLRAVYAQQHWHIGLTGMYDHYDKTVWPPLRDYNRYYLRGRTAAGISADYGICCGKWTARGEIATDRKAHPATTHTLRYAPTTQTAFTLQARYFSPRYVAPHADALQEGARPQNEAGLMVGLTTALSNRWQAAGYVDLFRFPRPTFRAGSNGSQGLEAYVKTDYAAGRTTMLQFSSRLKSRQQNVTGYKDFLEYASTNRLRTALRLTPGNLLSLHAAVDGTVYTTQTGSAKIGWMASARATAKPSQRWNTALFAAVFRTDNYAARLYAYEPQLLYAGAFPSFYGRGMRIVATATWKILDSLSLSARYGLLKYFDRQEIGTGTQLIAASAKNDVSTQIVWHLP